MKELWLEKEPSVVYGGKINQLINLCQLGLSVPKGLILPADQVMDWLSAALPEYSKEGLKELIIWARRKSRSVCSIIPWSHLGYSS